MSIEINQSHDTTYGEIDENHGSPRRIPKKHDHEVRLDPRDQEKIKVQYGDTIGVTLPGSDYLDKFYDSPKDKYKANNSTKAVSKHGEMSIKICKMWKPGINPLEGENTLDIVESPRTKAVKSQKTQNEPEINKNLLSTKDQDLCQKNNDLSPNNGKFYDVATQENSSPLQNSRLKSARATAVFRRGQNSVIITAEDREELRGQKLDGKLEDHFLQKPTSDVNYTIKGVELSILCAHEFNQKVKKEIERFKTTERNANKIDQQWGNYYDFVKNTIDDSEIISQKTPRKNKIVRPKTRTSPRKKKQYVIPIKIDRPKNDPFIRIDRYKQKLDLIKSLSQKSLNQVKSDKFKEIYIPQPIFSNTALIKVCDNTRNRKINDPMTKSLFHRIRHNSMECLRNISKESLVKQKRRQSVVSRDIRTSENQTRKKDNANLLIFASDSNNMPTIENLECLSPFRFPNRRRSQRITNASIKNIRKMTSRQRWQNNNSSGITKQSSNY